MMVLKRLTNAWTRVAGTALLSGVLLSGCAALGPDQPQMLQQAENAYKQANQNPNVSQNAPVALYEAEQALERARQAYDDGDEEEGRHWAYMAQQRVEIARARAVSKSAQKEVEQLGEQRRQVLLEARQQEAQQAQQEAQRATSRAKQMEGELAQFQAQTRETERGIVLTLGDVLFPFGKAALTPGSSRNLRPLVNFLKEYPDRQVVIEGHTDSVGPQDFNEQLSRERAQEVRQYLVSSGIEPNRVDARGFGEQYPVASNETPGGRQQNRRVDIVILREGETAPNGTPAGQ